MNLIQEPGFSAGYDMHPCERCYVKPALELRSATDLVLQTRNGEQPITNRMRVCTVCLAELVAKLPPLRRLEFTNALDGFVASEGSKK